MGGVIVLRCLNMDTDEKVILGYEILVADVNLALKSREHINAFAMGDRREQDYVLSNVLYFKAYTKGRHYIVIKRDRVVISGYPNLSPEMKMKFVEEIVEEIEGKS